MMTYRGRFSRLALGVGGAVLLLGSSVAMAIGPFHGGYCPPCDQPGDTTAAESGDLPPVTGMDGSDMQPSDDLAGAGTQDLAAAAFGQVPIYIDNAIPMNLIRLRYDNFQGANRADRAEYFYGTYSALGGPIPGVSFADDVDFEVISLYAERMISCQTSLFVEVPFRFVDLSILEADNSISERDDSGIGDINFGFKHVLRENCCGDYLTAQLRVYVPTGDDTDGLGVGHVSIEPAILWHKNVSCRSFLFGEIKDWIAVDATEVVDAGEVTVASGGGAGLGVIDDFVGLDFGGNVLEYGIGHAVWVSCCEESRLTLLNEFVGWTVLDGLSTIVADDLNDWAIVDADGDTIINWKVSLRYTKCQNAFTASYGTNLTDERWYSDIFRVQYERAY